MSLYLLFVSMPESADEKGFVSLCVPPLGRRAFGDWDFQLNFTAHAPRKKSERKLQLIFGAPEVKEGKIEGKGTTHTRSTASIA